MSEPFVFSTQASLVQAKPVIGGDVGGIRRQIVDGVPRGSREGRRDGKAGREHMRHNFLVPHYLRHWLMIVLAVKHPVESIIRLG